MQLEFAADPMSVRASLARLVASAPLASLCQKDRGTVELVLAEVLNNISEHAYAGHPGTVEVHLQREAAGLACQITDRGAAMPGAQPPPGRLVDPAAFAHADLPEGGFGWSMIRSLTTGLIYRREGGCNHLGFLIPLSS